MKLSIQSKNPNYLAKIVRTPKPRPHENADRLAIMTIDGQNVIVGKDVEEGQLFVYTPLECAINKNFLAFSNQFSDSELNADKTKKMFFSSSGRVRATRIRGVLSEGFLIEASSVENWMGVKFDDSMVGQEFDMIDNVLFVEKYVNKKQQNQENQNRKKTKQVKRESKLIAGQFHLSDDTENLKRNIHKINPEDVITIGYKLHGCNHSMGKVLCKKPLRWSEKVLRFFGVSIVDTHYDLVYASRSVIKNAILGKENNNFYDEDIWGKMAQKYQNCLKDGVELNCEIVGFTSSGSPIQKGYSYGQDPNSCEMYCYRAYYVSPSGDKFEFSTPQLLDYCERMGIKTVPIFYNGPAKDLFPEVKVGEHWNENFLAKLIEKYTEKDCYICDNGNSEEGVVLSKIECGEFKFWKLKSNRFLERESKELDSGEVDMETAQSIE